jgi:hypothetical protein
VTIKSGNGTEINCFYEAWAARHLDPLNPDEKLHVEYEGASPDDYPGDKSRFLVGGGTMTDEILSQGSVCNPDQLCYNT